MKKNYFITILIGLALFASGCASITPKQKGESAQTLYINGHVYTGNPAVPWASALAVNNGLFAYVGDNQGALAFKGRKTTVVDLKGQTVVPGLYDSHIHPISAGEELLYKCNFPQTAPLKEILSTVEAYALNAEKGAWITGGRWSPGLLHRLDTAMLDKVSHGHPVVLHDFSNHNIWANTAAIKAAGITEAMTAPFGERVQRDAKGKMTGVFIEAAADLITGAIPPRSQKQMDKALIRALEELHQFGIIGIKDSYAGQPELTAYNHMDAEGKLSAHVAAVIGWDKGGPVGESLAEQKARILRLRKMRSPHVRTDFAKISLDGIPPTKTAAMLEPYHPVSEGNTGALNVTEEDFTRDIKWLDAQGFTVKIHAVGDRAARICLNAFEAAQKANGKSGRRHEVAHACLISPEDIPRFASLDAVPDISPAFVYPGPLFSGMVKLLGKERTDSYAPLADFIKLGITPTYGTDWPVSPTVNPWISIEAFVTRENPYGKNPGQQAAPSQKISLEQALAMATINGARAQGIDHLSGNIMEGKTADFIILNQNIFSVAPSKISETQVLETVFEGRVVYQKSANAKGSRDGDR